MTDGGREQVAKTPKHMRTDGTILEVAHHRPQIGLALENVEMVHPEPRQLLLQLPIRIQRP
jgi:hypothetical protein